MAFPALHLTVPLSRTSILEGDSVPGGTNEAKGEEGIEEHQTEPVIGDTPV